MNQQEISKELLDRLVCAKYLYWRGIRVLDDNSSFSAGMSVLNFHDATEMVLRVVAEHIDASIKDYENFPSLMNKINKKGKELGFNSLTNTSALGQLNKARVNFKHHALEPQYKDANKFKLDLESFFNETLDQYLSIDFSTLSLADLVNHKRTSNWLHKAEEQIENSQPYEACASSAIAIKLFRKFKDRPSLWSRSKDLGREIRSYGRDRKLGAGTANLAKEVDERLGKIRNYIDVIYDGIDPLKYKKFMNFTPDVAISMANTIVHPQFDENGSLKEREKELLPEISNGTATFCYEFAIDTILELQSQNFPPSYELDSQEVIYVTSQKTPIYVYHSAEEIIDNVKKGAKLKSNSYVDPSENDDFIKILYDGERAYVPKENIETSSPISLIKDFEG